jgi:hypothetical protein
MKCFGHVSLRFVIFCAALFFGIREAWGQEGNEPIKWEYRAVAFQTENEGTNKLNELAAQGWIYVGPLSNGLVAFKRLVPNPKVEHRVMRINGYDYVLPAWWDSVNVKIPKDVNSVREFADYVKEHYSKDVGTQQTWKEALKAWALWCEQHDADPIYVAHCHATGGEHRRAAEIYHEFLRRRKERPMDESWAWDQCFLSYRAGRSYLAAGDSADARKCLTYASEFVGNSNEAVAHYAEEASKILKELDEKETKDKK